MWWAAGQVLSAGTDKSKITKNKIDITSKIRPLAPRREIRFFIIFLFLLFRFYLNVFLPALSSGSRMREEVKRKKDL